MAEQSRKRAEILACPHCGQDVGVTLGETARVEPCPHCGQAMTLPSVDGSLEVPQAFVVVDDEEHETDEAARLRLLRQREERLNNLRITALAGERRSLHRARLFALGLGAVLVIAALQGVLLIFRHAGQEEHRLRLMVIAAMSVAALYFGVRALRRAAVLSHKLREPLLDDPQQPPDFDPLSDGSQHWKNLEQMNETADEHG